MIITGEFDARMGFNIGSKLDVIHVPQACKIHITIEEVIGWKQIVEIFEVAVGWIVIS